MTDISELVVVKNLQKSFDGVTAVNDVSFSIKTTRDFRTPGSQRRRENHYDSNTVNRASPRTMVTFKSAVIP